MILTSIDEFLPKTVSDTFKFLFLLFAVTTTFVFEVSIVVPYVHAGQVVPWGVIHVMNGLYILHSIIGNLYFLIRSDSSIRNLVLPSVHHPGWRFCTACESNCPPRSFHCHSCGICILRRDHHCEFAGVCVGYRNYRYFLGLLFSLSIGAAYSVSLNQLFIWDLLEGLNLWNIACHTFPFFFWMFGYLPFTKGVYCLISVIDFAGGMFAFGLLLYHWSLMIRNQTNFESNGNDYTYDLGSWKENIKQAVGERGLLTLLSPFVSSSLIGDGIHYMTKKEFELTAKKSK